MSVAAQSSKQISSRRSGLPRAALLLVVASVASIGWAVDDEVMSDPPVAERTAQQPHQVDLGANFDANLFEQQGNGWVLRSGVVLGRRSGRGVGATVGDTGTSSRGLSLGEKRLERIEAACGLTEPQRRRLQLAIASDVRRFATEIDEIRSRYAGLEINMNEPAGQKQWHTFQQDVQQCRDSMRGLFESGSLFAAVLETTLDDEQRRCLTAETMARRTFHWRSMVLETLVKLDDQLGLSQRQHEVLEAELMAHELPLRTDVAALARDDQNLRRNLVYLALSQIDQQRIRAAVSDRQWPMIAVFRNQGQAMQSWIEQQGVLDGKP
jgi:hypothetical protein